MKLILDFEPVTMYPVVPSVLLSRIRERAKEGGETVDVLWGTVVPPDDYDDLSYGVRLVFRDSEKNPTRTITAVRVRDNKRVEGVLIDDPLYSGRVFFIPSSLPLREYLSEKEGIHIPSEEREEVIGVYYYLYYPPAGT